MCYEDWMDPSKYQFRGAKEGKQKNKVKLKFYHIPPHKVLTLLGSWFVILVHYVLLRCVAFNN